MAAAPSGRHLMPFDFAAVDACDERQDESWTCQAGRRIAFDASSCLLVDRAVAAFAAFAAVVACS